MRTRAALFALCLLLAGLGVMPALAQETFTTASQSVQFSATPSTHSLAIGESVGIVFAVQTSGQSIDGAELHLNFDPSKVEVTNVAAGTRLSVPILSLTYNNVLGHVDFAAGTFNNFPTQSFEFMTVTFRAIAAVESTAISIATEDVPRKTNITYSGVSVISPTQVPALATLTITDPNVTPPPSQSIVELVQAAAQGNPAQFTILLQAILAIDPSVFAALADRAGQYTVFAPTDDAFNALLTAQGLTIGQLVSDPVALANILKYHVLGGKYDSVALTGIANSGTPSLPTLNGATVTFSLQNGALFVNQAQVITPDIQAVNGVIHVIDQVLLPPVSEPTATPVTETPNPATETPLPVTETPVIPTETPVVPTPANTPEPVTEIRVAANTPQAGVDIGQDISVEIWLQQPAGSPGLFAIDMLCYAEQGAGIVTGKSVTPGSLFGPDPVVITTGFVNEQARYAAAQSGANPPVTGSGILFTMVFNAIGLGETKIHCDIEAVNAADQEVVLPYESRVIRTFLPAPTNTPVPTDDPTPTETPVTPEPTPTNTPEATPTSTPEIPSTPTETPVTPEVPPTPTETPVTPEPTPTNTPEATPTSTPEVPPTPTNTPEPSVGTISGVARRSNGPAAGISVTILLQGGTSQAVSMSMTTADDGSFRFEGLPEGTYFVSATAAGHLAAQGTAQVTAGQTTAVGTASLLAGDIAPILTADNVIDELDVVQLVAWYGQTTSTVNQAGDLNLDGRIGLRDLRALALNLRRTGPVTFQ